MIQIAYFTSSISNYFKNKSSVPANLCDAASDALCILATALYVDSVWRKTKSFNTLFMTMLDGNLTCESGIEVKHAELKVSHA